ncbi:MAG TPA: ABC transporter permease [Blastocatellia bacterium]|jgi:putative ABC transport system permease protein|nr:ABC transporter permease [Blastocatellia bacterium]
MKPHLWLITFIGVIVPRRLRADWRQEWEAELRYRETLLAEWDKLDRRNRLSLLWHSLGAFADALWLQPKRLEDEMFQDLRYGARMLLKTPGFTFVAVLTLALGIGANTAIFSLVKAVSLRPLPYQDPGRLAMLWTDDPKHDIHEEGVSYLNFLDWRSQSQLFTDMAICSRGNPVVLTGGDEPERVMGDLVSANLFPLLGVRTALGRSFSSDEELRRMRVVVISHGLWLRRFGASPDAIGKTLEIDGQTSQVIGVMPADFYFPTKDTQLWEPVTAARYWEGSHAERFSDSWRVVGRLKPYETFDRAQAEMNAIGQRLAQTYPTTDDDFAGFGVNVVPLSIQFTGKNLRLELWILFGAVVFVLLIACANVANLLLARGAAREREFAVRAALGAGRGRLIRQLLTESAFLALVSGLLGLGLAALSVRALVAFAPPDTPRLDEVTIDPGVLGFTAGVSLLTGLLFGLAPAWKASRSNPNEALKEGGRGSSGGLRLRQTRGLLVVVECALAVALLVSAGLMIRSFMRLHSVNPGFKPEGLLLARVSLPQATNRKQAQTTAFFRQVTEQVAALPGVQAVGSIEDFIMRRNPDNTITVEGRAPDDAGQGAGELIDERISHDLFQALSMPLLKGRFLTRQETLDSHVVIVNETLARRYFPGEDPIGKRFKFGGPQSENNWFEIAGVVGDLRRQRLEKQDVSEVYAPGPTSNMDLLVRVSADPLALAGAIRREIRSVDPTAAVYGLSTGTRLVEKLSAGRRFQTGLLALFAMVALVLAAIGIYGVMRYAVAQRTHEIGIRLALGARSADVLRLVIGQGMRLTLIGVATGLLASFALSRVMTQLLFGVSATDPATFAGVAFALVCAALLACYLPARRATKVDPLTSLRHE